MPGTYQKMEDGEGGRRHKHRHHSHHKHRHGEGSRHGERSQQGGYHPSTDTSLEINTKEGINFDVESTYKDSLYSPAPQQSVYGPGLRDSLYSGDEGGRGQQQSPGREREPRERHAENTFDAVTKHQSRRGQEERIWQDAVSRGAESGQIRGGQESESRSAQPRPQPTKPDHHLRARGFIEPGRPGSGLAAAAALARGDVIYSPKELGVKPKVPPPVPQKPDKAQVQKYNKLGMEELWPGGWDEYSE